MAALGMPYSLVYPPRHLNPDQSRGSQKWRHPMERMTGLYFEAEMAMTQFHMPFHLWLQLPKAVRIFQMALYRLHLEKENYYNTPPDKRFTFFNRD